MATQGAEEDYYAAGGRTVYDAGKTPMQNTPSQYYPHSPRWGAQSPGFGTEYGGGMSPGFSRPGSEYAGAHMGGNTRGPAGNQWLKRE